MKKAPRKLYAAYAVQADGTRQPIDARSIVIELPGGELEIDLATDRGAAVVGRLNVRLLRGLPLVIGPGDGGSTYLCTQTAARRQTRSR
jgi:hypothetical protein